MKPLKITSSNNLKRTARQKKKRGFYTYIVRCSDGSLYTGSCRSVEERVRKHNAGEGAKYTARRRPVKIVYVEALTSWGAALKREHQIKKISKQGKESLVKTILKAGHQLR